MLRRATAYLPWAVIDDLELCRSGSSFSYQTAEAMASKFPGSQLFWILGGDQWAALPRWKKPERLARRVEFAVLARGETPSQQEGYRLRIINGGHPATATSIREALKTGEFKHPWLAPAVSDWIELHGLYRSLIPRKAEAPKPHQGQ